MNRAVAKSFIILKVQVEDSDVNIVIDPLPTLLADESQIVLLMQNLLSNAIKFRGPERPRIRISATIGPGEWIISVQDNGIGLSMGDSERIFQMFQRLH